MTHFKARNLTALLLVLILLVSMFSTTALAAENEYITDFEAESEIIIEEEPTEEFKARRAADMESIAADLFTEGGASSYFPQNVGAGLAEGKGFNATNALGYVYKNLDGGNYWGNSIRLQADAIGCKKLWSGAEMLWFWVDAREFSHSVYLDLWLNWARSAVGSKFYLWDGVGQMTEGGTLPDAWGGGAGYGRIPLPAGYCGYIGLRLADFTVNTDNYHQNNIDGIFLYYETTDELPKTLVGKVAYRVLEDEELKKIS